MTHVVLGNAAVEIPVDTGLNGDIQSCGSTAADIGPGLPVIGAALPLIGHPVATGRYGEAGGSAHSAVVVFRLGGDHHRRLLGQCGKLPTVFPPHGPPIAIIVAGRIANGIVGDGFSVIGGQNIVYGVIGRQGSGCRWNKYTIDLRCWQYLIIPLDFEKKPWNPRIPGLVS